MSSPHEQCTFATTAPSSDVLDSYWESWQAAQPRTMGEIMKPLGLAELLTLEPGDHRWNAPRTNLDQYQSDWRRLPAEARAWLMRRFTRVL